MNKTLQPISIDGVGTNPKFDVIFGCDILYETINYKDLLRIIDNQLSDNGIALMFSKMFYFGNTGSVYEFIQFVNSHESFNASILKQLNDKVGGNTRAIIGVIRTTAVVHSNN